MMGNLRVEGTVPDYSQANDRPEPFTDFENNALERKLVQSSIADSTGQQLTVLICPRLPDRCHSE